MALVPELHAKFDLIHEINKCLGESNMANGFQPCNPGRVLCKEYKMKKEKVVIQPKNWREAWPAYTNKEKGYHPSSSGLKKYVKYIRNYVEYQIITKPT